jgi:hypothetical protein
VGVVVGGVLALVLGAIVIYNVGFPILVGVNSSGNVSTSQQANFNTVLTLLGVTAIIVALVVFMALAKMAG